MWDFAYEEDRWIYQNADISANPGEIVALIGPFRTGQDHDPEPAAGVVPSLRKAGFALAIRDGRPWRPLPPHGVLFSYIPQSNTLFTGTIADNMRMVKPEAADEEIRQALEAACAWEFVEKLEDGMNTQVRERGTRFSEGQKQRLSIARAILADAPVMILDEATSALDVATERRVLRRIIKKEPHRTILVAAHRPSVFAMCNRVYKIQDHAITQVDEQGIQEFLDAF